MKKSCFYSTSATKKVNEVANAIKELPVIQSLLSDTVVETPNSWTIVLPLKSAGLANSLRITATGHDHVNPPNESSVFLVEWLIGRNVQRSTKFTHTNKLKTIIDSVTRMFNEKTFRQFFEQNDKLGALISVFADIKQKSTLSVRAVVGHEITNGNLFNKGTVTISPYGENQYRLQGEAFTTHSQALDIIKKLGIEKPSINNRTSVSFGSEKVGFNMDLILTLAEFKAVMVAQYSLLPEVEALPPLN